MRAAYAICQHVAERTIRSSRKGKAARGVKVKTRGRTASDGRALKTRADRNRAAKQKARIARLRKEATVKTPKRPDPPNPKPKP